MTLKVVMTLFRYPGLPSDPEKYRQLGAQFVHIPCATEEELMAATREADVAVTALQPYTRRVIENMEHCRLINAIGIGYEGIEVEEATRRGILVANEPDYCIEEVSSHVLAFVLALSRKLVPLIEAVRAGAWDSMEKPKIRYEIMPPLPRLSTQTLGIVGLGRIGRAVAAKARAFGLRVMAYDPYIPAETMAALGVEKGGLEELLRGADYLSLNSAQTKENYHLIGREQLALMKPTAYLINTARGGLVDEGALVEALNGGKLAGAALDVTEPEPPRPDSPLLRHPKVLLTAHTAQFSTEAMAELRKGVEENIFAALRGEVPRGLVNAAAKEAFLRRWGRG